MVKVSVIIPAYNEEDYIKETLESVNNQTLNREEYETILCDGESEDATVEVAEPLVDEIISTENKSIGANRNRGAEHAEGEILLFLDADTRMPPTLLENGVKELEEPEVIVALPKVVMERHSSIVTLVNKLFNWYNLLAQKTSIISYLISGACIFVKKESFKEVDGFEEKLKRCEDTDLILKLREKGRISIVDDEVVTSNRRLEKMGVLRFVSNALNYRINYAVKDDFIGEYQNLRDFKDS